MARAFRESPFVYQCYGCTTRAILRSIPAVMPNPYGNPAITNINENRATMAESALARKGWLIAFLKRRAAPTRDQLKSDPNTKGTLVREHGRFCPKCLEQRVKSGWKVPAKQAV